jgi:hypothetical protein
MSFKSVQKKIAKKQGVSMKSAGAILASSSRNASAKNTKLLIFKLFMLCLLLNVT